MKSNDWYDGFGEGVKEGIIWLATAGRNKIIRVSESEVIEDGILRRVRQNDRVLHRVRPR